MFATPSSPAGSGAFLASGIPDGILEYEPMMSSLAKTLKLALLGCVMALGIARTADAAYVVINADPVYGAQFPGLSWRAVGALYVPDGCLTSTLQLNTPPGAETNPLALNLGQINSEGSCTQSKIQDVKLQFYQTATGAVVDTLNIGTYSADRPPPNTDRDLTIQELISFTFRDGLLSSFSTTLSTPMLSIAASDYLDPAYGSGPKCFALELSSATARVESFNYDSSSGTCSTTINTRPAADANNLLTAPTVTFATTFLRDTYSAPGFAPLQVNGVPEPASWALTLAALVAALGAGSRARRSRR